MKRENESFTDVLLRMTGDEQDVMKGSRLGETANSARNRRGCRERTQFRVSFEDIQAALTALIDPNTERARPSSRSGSACRPRLGGRQRYTQERADAGP
ncbi:hypothetical protein C9J85_17930 [Haloferax sp. wsp5]|nr:hypothetical protein C9J85_17930 [Haloferax sp. wsp5]